MNSIQTLQKMRDMRLHGMAGIYDTGHTAGTYVSFSGDELLSVLIDAEWQDRENKKVERLNQYAGFRYSASLSEINYKEARTLDKDLIGRLATCQFISGRENILITGPTGVGKSFIASALGHQACAMGFKTLYFNTSKLFTKLHGARADNTLFKEISKIEKHDLLILDDFGLQSLEKRQRDILMEIIEDRHNRRSTIIASQLPVNIWHDVIGEGTIADAILDRLVHSAHRIELSGESLRKVKK